MYMILIRPIVLYASEVWSFNKAEETMLKVFERKIFRKICGHASTFTRENGENYITMNLENCYNS